MNYCLQLMGKKRFALTLAFLSVLPAQFAAGQVVITEFQAINTSTIADPDFGQYSDWVEITNLGTTSADLTGLYITDNRSKLQKWPLATGGVLAAGQQMLVWADKQSEGLHTNFKLTAARAGIYLTDGVNITDSVRYDLQYEDVSMGRTGGVGSGWAFYNEPTPGSSNNTNPIEQVARVEFSLAGGLYGGNVNVSLSVADGDATIYYTTDGSEPTANDEEYNGSIFIDEPTPIRAIAMAPGKMSSIITTNTYLVGESSDLPVVMIAVDPDHFFSDETGIYVEGTNGVEDFCSDGPANWNMDWERPINFEYYEDGQQQVSLMAGTKIMGGCSRINAMKSLSVKFKSEYEGATVEYPFFREKPEVDEFSSLLLRNSGNDFNNTHFRDAMSQRLIADYMDLEYQAYQPVHMYINGAYWGIHNLRERNSTKYLEQNAGADPDQVDFLEKGENDVKAGDADHFLAMRQYWRDNDISEDAHYDYIKTQMEAENYADYMVAQIFYRNTDWPGNNIRFWRPKTEYGRWRWLLYDTDFGFWIWNNAPDHNTLEFALENDSTIDWPNPPWSTEMFRHLMTNDDFRALFLNKFLAHLAITFDSDRITDVIDEMAGVLDPEMNRHFDRWGGDKLDWYDEVDKMRSFGDIRPGYILDHLSEEYNLWSQFDLNVTSEYGAQTLAVNDVNAPLVGFDGVFYEGWPVTLSTSAIPGYEFVGWRSTGSSSAVLINQESDWKFLDDGSNQGTQYANPGFDDSSWSEGQGRLGYGGDGENTEVSYGEDPDNKYATTYFRKTFEVLDTNGIVDLNIHLTVDDGAIVYLNGTEVIHFNMADGPASFNDFAIDFMSGTDETDYVEYDIDHTLLVPGMNVIAVEVHQSSGTSSDMGFDLSMDAYWSGNGVLLSNQPQFQLIASDNMDIVADFQEVQPISGLFINEFVADNGNGLQDPSGKNEDWIEFYNGSGLPIDLGGLFISDTVGYLGQWRIPDTYPDSTTVAPYSHLVLFADKDTEEGVRHVDFKLGSAGEELYISQLLNGDTVIVDAITFGQQEQDVAYGRYPDGSNDWFPLSIVTPGAPNQVPEPITGIVINEFMTGNDRAFADNRGEFDDWIELYNTTSEPVDVGGLFLSDTLGNIIQWQIPTTYPDSTTIPAGGFLVLWADKDPEQGILHLDFSLGDKNEDIVLSQVLPTGTVILDQYSYGNQWRDVSEGRYQDGGDQWERFNSFTPGAANVLDQSVAEQLVINEILANSVAVVQDEFGEFDDYIELYNLTNEPIDIGGLWLTDTIGQAVVDRIPSNNPDSTTIPANGFITLWADGQPEQGVLHLDFKLSSEGEEVALVQIIAGDTTVIDGLAFSSTQPDIAIGRYSDGIDNWVEMGILTPDSNNVMDVITAIQPGVKEQIVVFPNPANDIVNVKVDPSFVGSTLEIRDVTGRIILGMSAELNNLLNLQQVPSGLYVLTVPGTPAYPRRLVVRH